MLSPFFCYTFLKMEENDYGKNYQGLLQTDGREDAKNKNNSDLIVM